MPKRFIKPKYRLVLSRALKKRLWLRLPYPLRLRIEHKCFLSKVLINNLQSLDLTALHRLKLPLWRKMSRLYDEILKLNNPYEAFTNAPISKSDVVRAKRMQDWIESMRASGKIYPF